MAFKTSLVLAPLLFAVACTGQVTATGENGPESDPVDPATAQIAGQYEVTSTFDLSNSADMPQIISGALGPLGSLADDPAGALIQALEGTDFGDMIDDLPDGIRNTLINELNTFIEERLYQGVPIAGQVAEITDLVATILTDFEVISNLQVGTVNEAGDANAVHSIVALGYPLNGEREIVAIPEIISTLAIARDVSVNFDFQSSTMNVGDHQLQLPLGDFAVTAFHAALETQLGIADLGQALSDLVNCDGLAANIGDVVINGLTVISVPQMVTLCEQGMDLAADKLDEQIAKLETAQLHFAGGDGNFNMESKSDGLGSTELRSMDGNWQSELGINSGGFSAPSSFTAVRRDSF
tara:strand:+ start:15374 stop:16432 length:1059 start_codon:yes stop_codon:yes gene_type:complete